MPKLQVPSKNVNNLSKKEKYKILRDINTEYETSYGYLQPIWKTWDEYWDKYKNEEKNFSVDNFKLKDYTMFSVLQTMIGHLSLDSFDFYLKPTSEADMESVELLEKILKYDFEKTKKDKIEREWITNTLFYGVSDLLLAQVGYATGNRKKKYFAPIPQVMNQRTFLYDIHALGGMGSRGGGYRYAGYVTQTTARELEYYKKEGYYMFDNEGVVKSGINSDADLTQGYNRHIQRYNTIPTIYGDTQYAGKSDNETIYLLEWWRYNDEGKVTHIIMPLNRNEIIRYEETEFNELPFITRSLYPNVATRNFFSIPYLTYSHQSGKQVVMNLAMDSEIRNQNGLWAYRTDTVKKPDQIASPVGAVVPVDGDVNSSLVRIPTNSTSQATDYIYNLILNAESQSTGSTNTQRGLSTTNQLATEVLAQTQSSNIKALLILNQWIDNEEDYVLQNVFIYDKLSSAELYNKIIRVNGDVKNEFIDLTKRKIKNKIGDVDVYVENRLLKEQKVIQDLPIVDRVVSQALQYEGTDKRQLFKEMGKKMDINEETLEKIYPPSADEMVARNENVDLEQGTRVDASVGEDHKAHIREHMLADSSNLVRFHIQEHRLLQEEEAKDQQLQQELAQQQALQQQAQEGQLGGGEARQRSNLTNVAAAGSNAIAPLGAEAQTDVQSITPQNAPVQQQ